MRTTAFACALILVLTGCQETMAACPAGEVLDDMDRCVPDPTLRDAGPDGGPDGGPDCGGPCTGETPICADTTDGPMCVECENDDDCSGETCNLDTHRCPECTTNAECMDPLTARCDATGFCAPCDDSAQCAQFASTPICNTATGACVECSVATEVDDCGANACDPVALTCTSTARGTLDTCSVCRADSECQTGRRCIELEYMGAPRDFYCIPTPPAGGCGTAPAPFRVALLDRTSRSGEPAATYCGIEESLTTCEAVVAALMGVGVGTCTPGTTADCPEGGRCETVTGGTNRCTYACTEMLECPASGALMTCPLVGGFCGDT